MLRELFARFPRLDGLVVRTGETYLHHMPHHTGNNPVTEGPASHRLLIGLLREEVCERAGKRLPPSGRSVGRRRAGAKAYRSFGWVANQRT